MLKDQGTLHLWTKAPHGCNTHTRVVCLFNIQSNVHGLVKVVVLGTPKVGANLKVVSDKLKHSTADVLHHVSNLSLAVAPEYECIVSRTCCSGESIDVSLER